jgi:hypothetical protein
MKIKNAPQAVNAPAGVHNAGKSLYLKKPVDDPGSGSWIFRYRIDGKPRNGARRPGRRQPGGRPGER